MFRTFIRYPFRSSSFPVSQIRLPFGSVQMNEHGYFSLPEFINSEVGALVPVDNEDMLCGAILEELLRSHEDPRRRAEISRYVKERFTQRLFVIKLEQLYASTLSIPRRLRNR